MKTDMVNQIFAGKESRPIEEFFLLTGFIDSITPILQYSKKLGVFNMYGIRLWFFISGIKIILDTLQI
jgi:hypothetical protein